MSTELHSRQSDLAPHSQFTCESALEYLAVTRPRLHASFRESDSTIEWVYPSRSRGKSSAGWSTRRVDVREAADKIRVRESMLASVRETKAQVETLRQRALVDCRTAWAQVESLPESVRVVVQRGILERAVTLSHRDLDVESLKQGVIRLL